MNLESKIVVGSIMLAAELKPKNAKIKYNINQKMIQHNTEHTEHTTQKT